MPSLTCKIRIIASPIQPRLLGFLKSLEHVIPPPPGCHHAITFAQHGSDAAGWNDRLALQVNYEGRFYCFFLDEGDLTDDLVNLPEHIKAQLWVRTDDLQRGVGFAQYSQPRSAGEEKHEA